MSTRGIFFMVVALAAGCDDDADTTTREPQPPADGGAAGPAIDRVPTLPPERGWTVHVPPFEVPAGQEITDCYFLAFPDLADGAPVWIDRVEVAQREGTHHMNIFRVNTVIHLSGAPGEVVRDGECKNLPNWADWPLVVNSQDTELTWQLPDGVAMRFEPGELLMLQTHYVNTTDQPAPRGGEVKVSFFRADEKNPIELGTLFAFQDKIRICQSQPQVKFAGHCVLPSDQPIHVVAANGHFHSRGKRLEMFTWDGVTKPPPPESAFYESLSWEEPPMATGLDALVPPGGGVYWTCEYEWRPPLEGCGVVEDRDPEKAGDCCYTFGNTATSAEHCNVFVYYWPKVDPSTVFCD